MYLTVNTLKYFLASSFFFSDMRVSSFLARVFSSDNTFSLRRRFLASALSDLYAALTIGNLHPLVKFVRVKRIPKNRENVNKKEVETALKTLLTFH